MARGELIAIVGCMFAGKTEELFRLLVRAKYAKKSVMVFKHTKDDRCFPDRIETHDGRSHPATAISDAQLMYDLVHAAKVASVDVVAIDEIQFFEPDVLDAMQALTRSGITVMATGLTTDFRGKPYKHVPQLMAIADEICICTAICVQCGKEANRSQLLVAPPEHGQDKPGGKGMYEARCRDCHRPPS